MKIEKLVLKNFSAVKNAMGTNQLEIDFSQSKNNVCLIIGPNGSGKTTLLSLLHPFADVGNLDIRNGNNLILKGKEGYKEIHIKNKNYYYIIKHYYSPHNEKNHSVKSYIEKNGTELNINGNVSSFKTLVKEELFIEQDYLKLIRLGSNVTSLIDLTTTERKNFLGKILEDVDIYVSFYKTISNKLRQLKDMMKITTNNINKLNIIDKDEARVESEDLTEEIKELENASLKLSIQENEYQKLIDNIPNKFTLKDDLKKAKSTYNKMKRVIDEQSEDIEKGLSFYETKIKELEIEKLRLENLISSTQQIIDNAIEFSDPLQNQIRSYQLQIKKEKEKLQETNILQDTLNDLEIQLKQHKNILQGFIPEWSLEEISTFIIFLKTSQQTLDRTYEFGKKPIKKVIELMSEKKNVMNYIQKHLLDIDSKQNDYDSVFLARLYPQLYRDNKRIVINCKEECIAKSIFIQMQNLLEDSRIHDENKDEEFYKMMEFSFSNINLVLSQFSEYKDLIIKLPNDISGFFKLESIYENIKELKPIFDIQKINNLLSLTTEYYSMLKVEEKIIETKIYYEKLNGESQKDFLIEELRKAENQLEANRDKIRDYRYQIIGYKEEIDDIKRTLESYCEIKETIEGFQSITDEYAYLEKQMELLESASTKQSEIHYKNTDLRLQIKNITKKRDMLNINIAKYEGYMESLNEMNLIYDEMTYTKDTLSPKQGIPLHFISNYLHNVEDVTNELLNIAYNGKIFIDNFVITNNEFGIPFINNGVRLEDVKYASQGELSFLSIALSFALSRQTLNRYNIMLLDEIDGPLDSNNREKFISILEMQIEKINSEQSFLITHNDMFSSYPVDIIDLSFKEDNGMYKLANFIPIKL